MPRRADPERIYQARRAALFANLTQTRVIDELDAEHLIAAWERSDKAQALDRLRSAFWDAAYRWIAEQRSRVGGTDDATKTDMGAEGDDGQVYGG
jgi:hypothetical protein